MLLKQGVRMTKKDALYRLMQLLHEMRTDCAWTKAQTWETLIPMTLDECQELAQSIHENKVEEVRDELADLLYHVLFYCQVASEEDLFDIQDVAQSMLDKQQRRNPPLGVRKTLDPLALKSYWQKAKKEEEKKQLSSLRKAHSLQEFAATFGFDWPNAYGVLDKLKEEIQELEIEIIQADKVAIIEEWGDCFFSLISLSRHLDINPEQAIEKANLKFQKRFSRMLDIAEARGLQLNQMPLSELEALWIEVKREAIS